MSSAKRDENREVALILQNTLGTGVLYPTAVSLTDSVAQHVAIVDGNGDQITSFGGGTQYTDGGTPPTHPVGNTLEFNNAGTWATVGSANPLPISGTISATNPSVSTTGSATPSSATLLGGSDGTNLQPLQVDASKNLKVLFANTTIAVTGTFWQTTQPVSGTFWQTTQPISAASLPLPTGAATAAKQPALGTAGTASSDVITVQGITSMTPLKVDGSGVTQPVSGTFWQTTQPVSGTFWQTTQPVSGTVTANIGAQNGLALDTSVNGLLLPQGGTTSGQSGPLILASVTSAAPTYTTAQMNPLSLTTIGNLRVDGSSVTQPVSGTFWQTTQPVSLASLPALATGSNAIGSITNTSFTATQATGSNLHTVVDSGTITTVSTVTAVTAISNALPAGTNNIGQVTPVPTSGTGWTFFYNAGGVTNTKVQIKGSAGTFGGWAWLYNPNTTATYLQVFNKASASVTVGSTTPDFVIVLPGVASASATGAAANAEIVMGIAMSTGITIAATTTETGSTAPSNNIFCTFLYK